MHYKIYFGDTPLFLCDKIDEEVEPYMHHDDAVFIDELNGHTIKTMIHEMQEPKVHAGIFQHNDLEELKREFFKKFTVIQAGGGWVLNEADKVLMIFRRGKWDLPKGKLDKGETLEDCAVREVEEETGIKGLQLGEPLIVTWHTYQQGTHWMIKESHWYTMQVKGEPVLIPQTEEDIEQAVWATKEEANSYKPNAFPAIIDVMRKAGW